MYRGHFFRMAYWKQLWANPQIDCATGKQSHKNSKKLFSINKNNPLSPRPCCTSPSHSRRTESHTPPTPSACFHRSGWKSSWTCPAGLRWSLLLCTERQKSHAWFVRRLSSTSERSFQTSACVSSPDRRKRVCRSLWAASTQERGEGCFYTGSAHGKLCRPKYSGWFHSGSSTSSLN